MKYSNGQQVSLGDFVKMDDGVEGTIVCSIDTDEYSEEYPERVWKEFLKKGVLVLSKEYGLIHYEEQDHIQLITRFQ